MSSRQYQVTLKLKDDGLLKKLEQLGNSGLGRGSGGLAGNVPSDSLFKKLQTLEENKSKGGQGGSILKSLESLGASQLLKLTGIGVGVGSMIHLLTKSSGQLEGVFKLWETSMTLIFKPFADFIALALRPLALTMLMFSIPFFKAAYPLFRDYAIKIGEFFNDPSYALTSLAVAIGGAVGIQLASRVPSTTTPSAAPSPIESKCIELCDKTIGGLSRPVGDGVKDGIGRSGLISTLVTIGTTSSATAATALLMNSTLTDLKTDVGLMKESMNNLLNKFPTSSTAGGKSTTVNLSENLGISDMLGADIFTGVKTDWGSIAASTAASAGPAALAAKYLDEAASAIGGAVGRLQSYASSIPNQFSWGFEYFGNGKITPAAGASRMRTTMAGVADAVSV